jgi:phage tail-like protein
MFENFQYRFLTREDWKDFQNSAIRYDAQIGGLCLKDGVKDSAGDPYLSPPLDSGRPGCSWHRIIIEAAIPENAALSVSFRAGEEPGSAGAWSEPWVFAGNSLDALIPEVSGRYLFLKVDFHQEGDRSPVLKQVRILYPRMSFLRYLPAIYRESETGGNFQERFLSIFETLLEGTGDIITDLPFYLDPESAPPEFYRWLAAWLSLDLYDLLGERNREYILRAVGFYRKKGTVAGLEELVSFLTGCPCCVKEYRHNIFMSYGMEQDYEDKYGGTGPCIRFHRTTSRTVRTVRSCADHDLLALRGKYGDRLHYSYGPSEKTPTSEAVFYTNHAVGLYIFRPFGQSLKVDKYQLPKIIKAFLPVFVEAFIIIVEGPVMEEYPINSIQEVWKDHIAIPGHEAFDHVEYRYRDQVPAWQWLRTYPDPGRTYDHGDKDTWSFRTFHSHFETWHEYPDQGTSKMI